MGLGGYFEDSDYHVGSGEYKVWSRFWIYPGHFSFNDGVFWNGFADELNWEKDFDFNSFRLEEEIKDLENN